ncbi:MAG: hypothetical protein JW791_03185 [Nanoarchaeota archaeon]|nr:hypothetical protein [Nanoarchaeota archaeon]
MKKSRVALIYLLMVPLLCYFYSLISIEAFNIIFIVLFLFSLIFLFSKKDLLALIISFFPVFVWEKINITSYEVFGEGWVYPSNFSGPPLWLILGWLMVLWAGLTISRKYLKFYESNRNYFYIAIIISFIVSSLIFNPNNDYLTLIIVLAVIIFFYFKKPLSNKWEFAGITLALMDLVMEHLAINYGMWVYSSVSIIPAIALSYFIATPLILCFGEAVSELLFLKLTK